MILNYAVIGQNIVLGHIKRFVFSYCFFFMFLFSVRVLTLCVFVFKIHVFSFLVSELAERGDLLKLWQVHGKMEEDLVKIYLVQIASAVGKLSVLHHQFEITN